MLTCAEVGFFINGHLHGNNSIITSNHIGTGSKALYCGTNVNTTFQIDGEWFYPNDSAVDRMNSGHNLYRNRNSSVVRLNRRMNATSTNGIYHCEIRDANKTRQNIFVGIYPNDEGYPIVSKPPEYTYDFNLSTQTLSCTSSEGPATTVVWKKNGVPIENSENQYQIIADFENATYVNILSLGVKTPKDIVGNHSCSIRNARGESEMSSLLQGMISLLFCMIIINCSVLTYFYL